MQAPLDITFRGMSPSTSVEGAIQRSMARLEHANRSIQHCSVVVGQPHLHHRRGNVFHVHVRVRAPEQDIAVSRETSRDSDHENLYVALAHAFRTARRQLLRLERSRYADVQRVGA